MIEETARGTIRRVYRTKETFKNKDTLALSSVSREIRHTPCLWEKLSNSGGFKLSEEGTTVYTSKMTDVSVPVKLLGDDSKA